MQHKYAAEGYANVKPFHDCILHVRFSEL
jgi:hypothetical protein